MAIKYGIASADPPVPVRHAGSAGGAGTAGRAK